jgi:antitoxin CptB
MQHKAADPDRIKKLKFRAWRRGFREADLILGPFADQFLSDMPVDQVDLFEVLLDQPDQDLYAWIIEREPTPPEFDHAVMTRIKSFRFDARTTRTDFGS